MTRSLILGLAVILAGVAHAAAARHLQQVGRPRPTPTHLIGVLRGRVETGGECGRPRGGGAKCTASGGPRETCWPGDPAFPRPQPPRAPLAPCFTPSRNTCHFPLSPALVLTGSARQGPIETVTGSLDGLTDSIGRVVNDGLDAVLASM